MTFKVEKQKLEVRIEKMTAENHEYEKELMAERQTNEQQKNNIERRQNRIKEAEAQLSALKESFA